MNERRIPIFVINLEDNVPRYEDVKSQLDALNLSFERIDAVAGKLLSQAEITAIYDKQTNRKLHHRNLTVGEIGCYMSHRKIWQMMQEQKIERALILEDDIVAKPQLLDCLRLMESANGWDVIKIADFERVTPAKSQRVSEQFELVSYKKVPNRTMGYFITRQAAAKMLRREKIYRPVDVDFQFYSDFDISVCGLRPSCIEISPEFGTEESSDIAKQNRGGHNNRSTFLRNLKYRYQLYVKRKQISFTLDKFSF